MKLQDLTGKRFGRLIALEVVRTPGQRTKWKCSCDCGQQKVILACHLTLGRSTSCGCRTSELTTARNVANAEHGMWKTNEFGIWQGMLQRCHDKGARDYPRYGGRGIVVCKAWRDSFAAFFDHIGPRPSKTHSVERIDNNLGYQPGNVRWATAAEQHANRRNNVKAVVRGIELTAAEIARRFGLSETTVLRRIHAGETGEELVAADQRRKAST